MHADVGQLLHEVSEVGGEHNNYATPYACYQEDRKRRQVTGNRAHAGAGKFRIHSARKSEEEHACCRGHCWSWVVLFLANIIETGAIKGAFVLRKRYRDLAGTLLGGDILGLWT